MSNRAAHAPTSSPTVNDDIGEKTRLRLYRTQVEIRQAEQRAFDLFLQNLVKGTSICPWARRRLLPGLPLQ